MKVQAATYKGGYDIYVQFEDGVSGTIHLNELIENGIFRSLKDPAQFAKVYTTGYSIAWSDQLEIDAAAVYAELSGTAPGNVYSSPLSYATN